MGRRRRHWNFTVVPGVRKSNIVLYGGSMYCQSCAAENAPELSFCKRCGSSLNPAPLIIQQSASLAGVTKPAVIIGSTMTVLTLGGFGAVISGAVALARVASIGSD